MFAVLNILINYVDDSTKPPIGGSWEKEIEIAAFITGPSVSTYPIRIVRTQILPWTCEYDRRSSH
jgi:hypothetical protein